MKALIEYLARALAEFPDEVRVAEVHDGDRVVLHLYVNESDKGRIIGRDGRCGERIHGAPLRPIQEVSLGQPAGIHDVQDQFDGIRRVDGMVFFLIPFRQCDEHVETISLGAPWFGIPQQFDLFECGL